MRTAPLVIALLIALKLFAAAASGTPTAKPATELLVRATLVELPADRVATVGFTRTSIPPGASLRATSGSGPAMYVVEAGALSLEVTEGDPPLVIRADSPDTQATPSPVDRLVETGAGDGLVLPPGSVTEFRNDGPDPAVLLDLVSAAGSGVEPGEGVTSSVLNRQQMTLPDGPVVVSLMRTSLEPGQQLTLPAEPVQAFYAPVDRSQAIRLSGQGVNRWTQPIDVYLLVIEPRDRTSA